MKNRSNYKKLAGESIHTFITANMMIIVSPTATRSYDQLSWGDKTKPKHIYKLARVFLIAL